MFSENKGSSKKNCRQLLFLGMVNLFVLKRGFCSRRIRGNRPYFVLAIDPLAQILENAITIGLLHKIRGRRAILRTSL
jgi:hypothetical protein